MFTKIDMFPFSYLEILIIVLVEKMSIKLGQIGGSLLACSSDYHAKELNQSDFAIRTVGFFPRLREVMHEVMYLLQRSVISVRENLSLRLQQQHCCRWYQ
jgi:hypothetical protein